MSALNVASLHRRSMANLLYSLSVAAIGVASACGQGPATNATAKRDGVVPLPIKYPEPDMSDAVSFYWSLIESRPDLEPFPTNAWKELPTPFLAQKGVTNIAFSKKAATGAPKIFRGTLAQVTDGNKAPSDHARLEFSKGTQWIQVDLGAEHTLFAVAIWHENMGIQYFRDVIVQIADDLEFTKNVQTLFNNDGDNSSGLGKGSDREYYESRWGKLIDGKGAKARYVRSYSNGNSLVSFNMIVEIEVYGVP